MGGTCLGRPGEGVVPTLDGTGPTLGDRVSLPWIGGTCLFCRYPPSKVGTIPINQLEGR